MKDTCTKLLELAKKSDEITFYRVDADEMFEFSRMTPKIISALCERYLKLARAIKPLQDLTNAALAGIKPLPSQVQSAFDVLAELEKDSWK